MTTIQNSLLRNFAPLLLTLTAAPLFAQEADTLPAAAPAPARSYSLTCQPFLALKTNLLFDAVTALNVELEAPIGLRWSVAGEGVFPWWLWEKKQYCLQLLSGNLEGRYWFGERENSPRLTGWFAGLYAGGGCYDLEWEKRGVQGEFYIAAGVSGGYAHRIGKHGDWRMEYSLGVGYLQTKYREYNASLNGNGAWSLLHQQSGNYTWIGPTRAKISLVWLLSRGGNPGKKLKIEN